MAERTGWHYTDGIVCSTTWCSMHGLVSVSINSGAGESQELTVLIRYKRKFWLASPTPSRRSLAMSTLPTGDITPISLVNIPRPKYFPAAQLVGMSHILQGDRIKSSARTWKEAGCDDVLEGLTAT